MTTTVEKTPELNTALPEQIESELNLIWEAHRAVGLEGYMCLYTNTEQVPFRAKEAGIKLWFNQEETANAAAEVVKKYNDGRLPNSPLLLNPIVHEKLEDGTYKPLGSAIAWCTSLCLGINSLNDESTNRIWESGFFASPFHRGIDERSGLKVVAICDEILPVTEDGKTVTGCRELYDLADVACDQYWHAYLLSGIAYLTNNGLFLHPDVRKVFTDQALVSTESRQAFVKDSSIRVQNLIDAAYCWNAYERHHSLYIKFGPNPETVETNLKFFNLVARDVQLFDATGPMRKDAEAMMEFLVPGLIPCGAVTLLAAGGGTGKSSLAHQLGILSSIDYEPGEEAPKWLGQRVAIEKCKGVNIYFAGEDGPAIINARANIMDPEGRARRLMFQRTDFGAGVTFAKHMERLHKIPNISILIIDPARKYLGGDENDPNIASDFFSALEEFAVAKNTAVLVVHHIQKGANPKSMVEITDMLRGAEAFADRPRVIIGMLRDGAYTIAGLAKNSIPPSIGMVTEERVFARDAKRLSLVWLPGHEGVRNANLSEEELQKIAEESKQAGR